jgi:hypothetical protein
LSNRLLRQRKRPRVPDLRHDEARSHAIGPAISCGKKLMYRAMLVKDGSGSTLPRYTSTM